MPQTNTLNITLSAEAIQFVRNAIDTGEFATASEVLESGLDMLQSDLEERRRWEREVVVPAYHRLKANPSSALSLQQIETALQDKRDERARHSLETDGL